MNFNIQVEEYNYLQEEEKFKRDCIIKNIECANLDLIKYGKVVGFNSNEFAQAVKESLNEAPQEVLDVFKEEFEISKVEDYKKYIKSLKEFSDLIDSVDAIIREKYNNIIRDGKIPTNKIIYSGYDNIETME